MGPTLCISYSAKASNLSGFWQSHVYKPQDMYWGQLGGALEAINSGTTFVLDHAHGNQTNQHGEPRLLNGLRTL